MTNSQKRTAKEVFDKLNGKRQNVLMIGRDASKLTIPSLLPPEGQTKNSKLERPNQGFGARCVKSLAAKLLLALFPTNTPFFKLALTREVKEEKDDKEVSDIQQTLSRVEADTLNQLQETNMRSILALALKYLPAIGECCIAIDKDGNFKNYRLDNYVVVRNETGSIVTLVIKEEKSFVDLSDEIKKTHFQDQEQITELEDNPDQTIPMYIHMYMEGKKYKVYQEINDITVEGSEGSYPLNAPEFIVARWSGVVGDDYGRGEVEDYIPDFQAIDDYSCDMSIASRAAAKIIYAVDGNGKLKRSFEKARSGDVLNGDADDIKTVSLDKNNDFRITLEKESQLRQDLSSAFLLNSSVSRDAERVTAEEIRFLIQEIEDSLGGVYSHLSEELQKPLLRRYLSVLHKKRKIPNLAVEGIQMQITTGLEALGRSHDLNKLVSYIRHLNETIGEERVSMIVNPNELAKRLGMGIGVDTEGLIKTEEEIQEEHQQQQMETLVQSAGPGAIQEGLKQGQQGNI